MLVYVVDDEDAALARAHEARGPRVARAGPGPAIRAELVVGTADETLRLVRRTEGARPDRHRGEQQPSSTPSLGTTAENVIATTRVPVLVVRDPAPWLAFARGERPLRLLLGIDDSVACELGIQWTHALRKRGPVEVVLGAVYYPDDARTTTGSHARALVDRDPEIERLLARDLLRRFGDDPSGVTRGRAAASAGSATTSSSSRTRSRSTRSSSAPARRPGSTASARSRR